MLVSDIINIAAKRLDFDVDDYDIDVMIHHINGAIARINNGLITKLDPEVIKQVTITDPIARPSDYMGQVPPKASYPVSVSATTISRVPGAPPSVVFKYSTFKPRLTAVGNTIPLPDYCISEIVDYVVIHYKDDIGEEEVARLAQTTALSASDEALLFSAKGG